MKHRYSSAAFTLIELLTVIAIIAILAAMIFPVLSAAQTHAKKVQTKLEASNIANAIQEYESDYTRFPVSTAVQSSGNEEFTYGATFQGPNGPQAIGTVINGNILTNSDVIAILLDYTNFPNSYSGGGWTCNTNHMKNPKRSMYLSNTKFSNWDPGQGGQPLGGIGDDLVYRDPFGNPYVISMDLDEDNFTSDYMYGSATVSSTQPSSPGAPGLNGLNWHVDNGVGSYCYHGNVMVWSAGPDGKVDTNSPANSGPNKDNVVSWQ